MRKNARNRVPHCHAGLPVLPARLPRMSDALLSTPERLPMYRGRLVASSVRAAAARPKTCKAANRARSVAACATTLQPAAAHNRPPCNARACSPSEQDVACCHCGPTAINPECCQSALCGRAACGPPLLGGRNGAAAAAARPPRVAQPALARRRRKHPVDAHHPVFTGVNFLEVLEPAATNIPR